MDDAKAGPSSDGRCTGRPAASAPPPEIDPECPLSLPDDRGPDAVYAVTPAEQGLRLDRFLSFRLKNLSRERIQAVIRSRTVVPGRNARPSLRVKAGDLVCVKGRRASESGPCPPVRVLFQDEHLVAAVKPAGFLSHPSGRTFRHSFLEALRKQLGHRELYLVHRLDRETSGVSVLARSKEASRVLSSLFHSGCMLKVYAAVVCGVCRTSCYTVREPVPRGEGKPPAPAVTVIEPVCSTGHHTLVTARPLTGRKHQIRRHLSSVGHPILGDRRYGGRPSPNQPRLYLHAYRLEIPSGSLPGDYPPFISALPREFRSILKDGATFSKKPVCDSVMLR